MTGEVVALLLIVMLLAVVPSFFRKHRLGRPVVHRRPDADMVKVVLGLEQQALEDLFRLYRQEFGTEAARYARRTYNKWKSGEVRPNRQTFNRLLVHLPSVMSFDLKCEVLRKLGQEYCSKADYRLTVDTRSWREDVTPLVAELVNKSYAAQLPRYVERKLRWLAADDMRVARSILAQSQAQESQNALFLLEREFANMEQLLRATGARGEVTHTVKLPLGTITLTVERRLT
ncbi:MAG TPA: hypothetical protein VJT74_17445 [Pyrinomonadaceae bacterium]|nr:hypothetical protein [Pyrinomonadaceae bacterium]